jgi:hypothetical protein
VQDSEVDLAANAAAVTVEVAEDVAVEVAAIEAVVVAEAAAAAVERTKRNGSP